MNSESKKPFIGIEDRVLDVLIAMLTRRQREKTHEEISGADLILKALIELKSRRVMTSHKEARAINIEEREMKMDAKGMDTNEREYNAFMAGVAWWQEEKMFGQLGMHEKILVQKEAEWRYRYQKPKATEDQKK